MQSITKERCHLRAEPEAERAVIGALLLAGERDRDAVRNVFGTLAPRDFIDEQHRAIFAAMSRLHERNAPIEPTMIVAELDGAMENPAGLLLELGQSVATAAHLSHHARLVAEASRQRRLVCAANDALNAARNARTADDVDEAKAVLLAALDDIGRSRAR